METRSKKSERQKRELRELALMERVAMEIETHSRKSGRERLQHERVKAKIFENEMESQKETLSVIFAKLVHFGSLQNFEEYHYNFNVLANDRIVFEKHGEDLQKHGETVDELVCTQTCAIKKALDQYAVSLGVLPPMELSLFSDKVLSRWQKYMSFRGMDHFGPHYILYVMLLEYLERLEGTDFVSADRSVKPGTVMVLLMLAIRYNDDHAPAKCYFNGMIRSVMSIANMTLDEIGMKYSEPPLRENELEEPIPRWQSVAAEFLSADIKEDTTYMHIKYLKGETDASVIFVNAEQFKNVHEHLTLVALNALEVRVLQALGWRLGYVAKPGETRSDGITPKEGEEESPHWNLAWHDADAKHWFWKRLAQITSTYPDEEGVQSEKKV
jgi:hypothetical protein